MTSTTFRAAGFPWRLYCGPQVIEQSLKEAVDRAGAKRAFVVCSPSVNRRTDTVRRIEAALDGRYAGVFDGIEKDSTYASVRAARTVSTPPAPARRAPCARRRRRAGRRRGNAPARPTRR